MILLTNGCSWTYGGGLGMDQKSQELARLSSVWPYYLGQKMAAETVVQLAEGCGSNQRIIRTCLQWLMELPSKYHKDVVAVIQWTDASRYEYYQPLDYKDLSENYSNRWAKVKTDLCLQTTEDQTLADQRMQLRLQTNSYQEDYYNMIRDLSALRQIFHSFGITRVFYWSHCHLVNIRPLGRDWPQHLLSYYQESFPWLDDPGHTHWYWQYDRVSEQDMHPGLDGHRQIADIIWDKIKDQVK